MQRMNSGRSQPEVASCSTVWGYGDGYPPQMLSVCRGGCLVASLSGQRELGVIPAAPLSGFPWLHFPGAERRSIKPGVDPWAALSLRIVYKTSLKVRFPLNRKTYSLLLPGSRNETTARSSGLCSIADILFRVCWSVSLTVKLITLRRQGASRQKTNEVKNHLVEH